MEGAGATHAEAVAGLFWLVYRAITEGIEEGPVLVEQWRAIAGANRNARRGQHGPRCPARHLRRPRGPARVLVGEPLGECPSGEGRLASCSLSGEVNRTIAIDSLNEEHACAVGSAAPIVIARQF